MLPKPSQKAVSLLASLPAFQFVRLTQIPRRDSTAQQPPCHHRLQIFDCRAIGSLHGLCQQCKTAIFDADQDLCTCTCTDSHQCIHPKQALIQNDTITAAISARSTTNVSKLPCLHLCPQQVAESIAEPMACWIRFLGNETTAPTVELAIQIQVVAAAPVAWGMAIVAGASQPTPRDQGEVQCGQPFRLEIVAHDKYGHR